MHALLEQLLQWVTAHPHLAGLFVFLLAFAESLAGIGLLVPGAVIMFGMGGLIGLGSLAFWPIYFWSVGGAILGDGLSYWLGRHFHQQMRNLWPFRRHPEALEKGERFFRRHGGKSVLLGRFVGPLRPVIPVVAGMLDMPARRFYVANVLSALAWAPLYLLPGMAFAASLALAGEVAGRLALLLASLLVAAWLLGWLIRTLYLRLQPHALRWIHAAMLWAARHPRLGWLVAGLVDPGQPPSRSLAAWLVLLTGGGWLFLFLLVNVLGPGTLHNWDHSLNRFLQDFRNPLMDRVMVVFSELGDSGVVIPVLLASLGWLWWRGCRQEMAYWVAAVIFGKLAVLILKGGLGIQRPAALYAGWEAFSFPSGHATMSVIIYGYLAVSSAREMPPRWRWFPYAVGGVLIAGIAFSRVYLGAHWPSDVLAGLAMGLAWVAVSRIALRRHRHAPGTARGLTALGLVVLLAAGSWHVARSLEDDLHRYAPRQQQIPLALRDWWEGAAWRDLPTYRRDMEGMPRQPFNVQWAAPLSAIRARLRAGGWQPPPPLNWKTALRWLQTRPALLDLPLPPHLNGGRFESLLFILPPEETGEGTRVLQLWDSGYRLQPGDLPLWVGSASRLVLRQGVLLSYPRIDDEHDVTLARLAATLPGVTMRHLPGAGDAAGGRFDLLLLRGTGASP